MSGLAGPSGHQKSMWIPRNACEEELSIEVPVRVVSHGVSALQCFTGMFLLGL